MASDLQRDLSLVLMYLSSRAWKGVDPDVLNTLEDQALVIQSGSGSRQLTDAGVKRARELLERFEQSAAPGIVRLFAGSDGQSHFEDVEPTYTPGGDESESTELIAGSGMLVRRFAAGRTNPWHHAPGRYMVFTLCGAVDISVGDGSARRIGPGQVLIAEDLSGQGHETREVGPEARVSVFVPLPTQRG